MREPKITKAVSCLFCQMACIQCPWVYLGGWLANNGTICCGNQSYAFTRAYSLDIDMPSFLEAVKVQDRARSWNATVHASDVRWLGLLASRSWGRRDRQKSLVAAGKKSWRPTKVAGCRRQKIVATKIFSFYVLRSHQYFATRLSEASNRSKNVLMMPQIAKKSPANPPNSFSNRARSFGFDAARIMFQPVTLRSIAWNTDALPRTLSLDSPVVRFNPLFVDRPLWLVFFANW